MNKNAIFFLFLLKIYIVDLEGGSNNTRKVVLTIEGCSNEYQYVTKIKKTLFTPVNPTFLYIKWGLPVYSLNSKLACCDV